jgi:hypothetical protein
MRGQVTHFILIQYAYRFFEVSEKRYDTKVSVDTVLYCICFAIGHREGQSQIFVGID